MAAEWYAGNFHCMRAGQEGKQTVIIHSNAQTETKLMGLILVQLAFNIISPPHTHILLPFFIILQRAIACSHAA